MFAALKRHFLVGVLTIAPFAITAYLIFVVGAWFDAQFQPFIQLVLEKVFRIERTSLPGVGIVIGLVTVIVVGWLAPSFIGRQAFGISEKAMARIPLVKAIYAASKQIFDAFSQGQSEKFRRVVMVPFPLEGSYSVGFVTSERKDGWVPGRTAESLAVFVPTTPNPTSGYLIFVRPEDAINLDMSVEEALKLVVSAGLAQPDAASKKKLA